MALNHTHSSHDSASNRLNPPDYREFQALPLDAVTIEGLCVTKKTGPEVPGPLAGQALENRHTSHGSTTLRASFTFTAPDFSRLLYVTAFRYKGDFPGAGTSTGAEKQSHDLSHQTPVLKRGKARKGRTSAHKHTYIAQTQSPRLLRVTSCGDEHRRVPRRQHEIVDLLCECLKQARRARGNADCCGPVHPCA